MEFLVETALLTRGLACLGPEVLREVWPTREAVLVWMDRGQLIRGDLEAYLAFRPGAFDLPRLDDGKLPEARQKGLSGSLTASGTMAACQELGISLAITCGMGGVGQIQAEQICADLPALTKYPVALLAASPKDMLDIPATIRWLLDRGVHVAGPACTGWVFNGDPIPLEEDWDRYPDAAAVVQGARTGGLLLLNPIPPERRIQDHRILQAAIQAGLAAEAVGGDYHPAANAELHRQTDGYSARLQLQALVNNLRLAASL